MWWFRKVASCRCLVRALSQRALLLGCLFSVGIVPAFAGEEPEHYHLVYTLARTVGFNDAESRMIAAASWSVDLNDDTTAYEASRGDRENVAGFFAGIAFSDRTDDSALRQLFSDRGLLRHAPKGMLYHALGGESSRRAINAHWQQLIGSTPNKEERLILTGMYLHFVVDRYVHPPDAILGHALAGHEPDRAIHHTGNFRAAAGDVYSVLRNTFTGLNLRDRDGRTVDERLRVLGLDNAEKRQELYANTVSAVSRAYAPHLAIGCNHLEHPWCGEPVDFAVAAQQLKQQLDSKLATVGETFDIVRIDRANRFVYRTAADGTLVVASHSLFHGKALRIKDPVAALQASSGNDRLAVAKRDLVEQVKNYYNDSLVVATSIAPGGIRLNQIAASNAERVVVQAAERFTRAKQESGVLYNRSRDAGVEIYQRSVDGAIKVWRRAGDKLQVVEKRVGEHAAAYEVPLRAAASAMAQTGSVGGIRLDYGSDVLNALRARADTSEISLIRVDGPFRLVSLRSLVRAINAAAGQLDRIDEPSRSVANLSRIYGYMVDSQTRDVILIGGTSANAPSIKLDDLVTGVKAVYRDGVVPMISLDPDPSDFAGPQKVRLSGVPSDSHFARIMVEADYEMKKIIFGALPIKAGNFRSQTDLMLDRFDPTAVGGPTHARYWLTPVQPGPSDIQVSAANDEALFLGRVQVLTEAMEHTSSGIQGTGSTDPVAEEAVRLFTANYQAIASQRPVFRVLEGLNDVVLLATLLRKAGVKEAVLTELAGKELRSSGQQPLPMSLPGVVFVKKKEMSGGIASVQLTGGVNLRPVAARSKWARYRDTQLAKLREAVKRLTASRTLFVDPGIDSLIVSAPRGQRGELELAIEQGSRKLAARQYKDAEADFSRVIAMDDTASEAYVGRAIASAALGNSRRAFRDARKALELDPDDEDLAAMKLSIGLESGMDLTAVFDGKNIPQNVRSRAASLFLKRGVARVSARKMQDAERDYSWALLLDPDRAEAHFLRGALRVELAAAGNGTKIFDEFAPQAFADLNRAIQLDPKLGSSYAARSKLKTLSFDFAGAIEDASTVIRLDPNDAVGYSHRGMARARMRRFDEALGDLTKAIALAPGDARPHFNRGLLNAARGNREAAIGDFASALERDPSLMPEVQKQMEDNGLVGGAKRK